MFHLFVRYDNWSPTNNFVHRDRALEIGYTRPELLQHFKPNGLVDVARAKQYTTAVLVTEINGKGPQHAQVCQLKDLVIDEIDGSVQVVYEPIPHVPLIPSATLSRLSKQLDLDPTPGQWPELQRSHWAMKNVDLFQVLYQEQAQISLVPKILKFSETVDPKLVAVMMPFQGFDGVYEAIKAAAAQVSMQCQRADEIWTHHKVIDDITLLISRAAVVVCDFTDRNPNVFYETGIAHAIGKSFIPITQHPKDVPFDLQAYRFLAYLNNQQGLQTLTTGISQRLKELIKAQNGWA